VTLSTLLKLAQAVTNEEGQPGDRNYRNNNPGNLKPPDGSANYWVGQVGVDPDGFAIFDTWASGMNALVTNLSVHVANNPNQTLTQYFAQYSPDSTGLSGAYGAAIASALGVTPDTTLGSL
jgi:hypothetical protein